MAFGWVVGAWYGLRMGSRFLGWPSDGWYVPGMAFGWVVSPFDKNSVNRIKNFISSKLRENNLCVTLFNCYDLSTLVIQNKKIQKIIRGYAKELPVRIPTYIYFIQPFIHHQNCRYIFQALMEIIVTTLEILRYEMGTKSNCCGCHWSGLLPRQLVREGQHSTIQCTCEYWQNLGKSIFYAIAKSQRYKSSRCRAMAASSYRLRACKKDWKF